MLYIDFRDREVHHHQSQNEGKYIAAAVQLWQVLDPVLQESQA